MDLQEFTHLTLTVLEDQGTGSYAPTIISGETNQVIQGIPEGVDQREAIQEVQLRLGLEQSDFFFWSSWRAWGVLFEGVMNHSSGADFHE